MKIEHFALNVSEPAAMAAWYEENIQLKIVRKYEDKADTHFLADSSGDTVLEIYNNPPDEVPDYKNMNPLIVHLAFVSKDAEADKQRLLKAGATFVEDVKPADGSLLVMMKDPWGVSIQLCQRAKAMLRSY